MHPGLARVLARNHRDDPWERLEGPRSPPRPGGVFDRTLHDLSLLLRDKSDHHHQPRRLLYRVQRLQGLVGSAGHRQDEGAGRHALRRTHYETPSQIGKRTWMPSRSSRLPPLHAAADAIVSDAFAASRSHRDSNAYQKTFIVFCSPDSRLGKFVAGQRSRPIVVKHFTIARARQC
jgi:hypothetical protein